jgi:transcriptional regulator with XRE-family HTH domain
VSETLRLAILASGRSLYRIAKDSGVDYATVHRFVNGRRSLSVPALDRLAEYLGLELTRRK